MSVGALKRIRGDGYLAIRAVFVQPFKRLFAADGRTGAERFLANYAPEGLVVLTQADRDVLRGASRCIHCGLCDAFAPVSALPKQVCLRPSQLAVSLSRATPDLPSAQALLASVDPSSLGAAEAVCPTRVPLGRIAVYVQSKLKEVLAARAS